jgi:hypothetical protein
MRWPRQRNRGTYSAFGVPVADVARTFQTDNTVRFFNIPLRVILICSLTWMCAPPPRGPNIHANDLGYAVIAATFVQTIRRR